jgi:2-hydroxy-4-(methylsulfanyl)butanoate S-methyltransferase
MSSRVAPIADVRDISKLAYGFMAAKALFAALDLDLFTHIGGGTKSVAELEAMTGVREGPLTTLLTACASLGLVIKSSDRYGNAPAVQEYLVRGSPK